MSKARAYVTEARPLLQQRQEAFLQDITFGSPSTSLSLRQVILQQVIPAAADRDQPQLNRRPGGAVIKSAGDESSFKKEPLMMISSSSSSADHKSHILVSSHAPLLKMNPPPGAAPQHP